MQNSCSEKDIAYAGFWVRFAAFLADSLIVGILLLAARLVLAVSFSVFGIYEVNPLDTKVLFSYTWRDIILYLLGASYYIICTYCAGTTAGKRLFNLRVISSEGGNLRLADVIYRETIGKFLSGVIMNIGYIIAGIDREKRALHDIMCDTRVIYAKRVKIIPVRPGYYTAPRGPMPQNMPGGPNGQNPQNMTGTINMSGPQNMPGAMNMSGSQDMPGPQNAQSPRNVQNYQNMQNLQNTQRPWNAADFRNMQNGRDVQNPWNIQNTQNMAKAAVKAETNIVQEAENTPEPQKMTDAQEEPDRQNIPDSRENEPVSGNTGGQEADSNAAVPSEDLSQQ